MSVFSRNRFERHESVHFFHDPASRLRAIISIHSTRRGPTAGGTRFWSYENDDEALSDALDLSRAMSYKNAMADIPFGGGKAVIMKPDGEFDRNALFKAYGESVESLGGLYYTAADVGVSPHDMKTVRSQTRYVAGLASGPAASGDPSTVTADGVFRGLQVAVKHRLHRSCPRGLHVAVQGLGHVGYNLCERLHGAGVNLSVADICEPVLKKAKNELGAEIVDVERIHSIEADIFAPCALGGSINANTVNDVRASIVGGAANNQLSSPDMGEALRLRHILYCPDYVINGGGIINVAAELSGRYDPEWVDGKLDGLKATLDTVFEESTKKQCATNKVADEMAKQRIHGNV